MAMSLETVEVLSSPSRHIVMTRRRTQQTAPRQSVVFTDMKLVLAGEPHAAQFALGSLLCLFPRYDCSINLVTIFDSFSESIFLSRRRHCRGLLSCRPLNKT